MQYINSAQEEKKRRNLELKLILLRWCWKGFRPQYAHIRQNNIPRAIGFLNETISSWHSDRYVTNTIGILLRLGGELVHKELDVLFKFQVGYLVNALRDDESSPEKSLGRVICILKALGEFYSPDLLGAVSLAYKELVKPIPEDQWDPRGDVILELAPVLCQLIRNYERRNQFSACKETGLRCLIDMTFHPTESISTHGFCTLMRLRREAPQRYNFAYGLMRALGHLDGPVYSGGVKHSNLSHLSDWSLLPCQIDDIITACMSEVEE